MAQFAQMIEDLDDCFVKTAGNIIKYCDDDEEEMQKELKELREVLIENCTEFARIKAADKISEQMQCVSELQPDKDVKHITQEYKKAIIEIQVNPLEDNRLLEYDRQIEGLLQATKAESNNGADDTDADLRLTGSEINVIDPISKTRMTDPVRNAVCGHVYDRESLVAMLEKNKNTRCPVVGCTSLTYIDLSQCRSDIVTKTFLERNPA
ncbi:E3 SUMO-protein ligase NSE2-like [Temnothorax curvispinosus]|uniref:E3 SUMO-protein ligase NSE2 n=1 Tax=Temnothorax curvispinosus TaxID=300111 RepID=A0A6J1RJF6_9HYME|nr:E3 SUMO-protein ligase NSE2-like [Temnothorax curvispinosus]